jgi:hypothetical protein
MLKNKKLFFLLPMLFSTSLVNAGIVGVGQIGEKYVYKVNGILVVVSESDIIDGCIIKAGSGLQCSQQNSNLNNINYSRDLSRDIKKIEPLLDKNSLLNTELKDIKLTISAKLAKKNKQLNKLSSRLNAVTRAQQNGNLNNIDKLKDSGRSFESLNALLDKNQSLQDELAEKENEINNIKIVASRKLTQKNRQINKLSNRLNAFTQSQ